MPSARQSCLPKAVAKESAYLASLAPSAQQAGSVRKVADGLVQRTLVLLTALLLLVPAAHAAGVRFQSGDVFAAVGRGVVKHFSPTGALLDTLNFGAGTFDTGMAFDASGSLYVTGFDANNVYKFDQKGNLLGTFGSGYNADPESIVFDRNGNAYVGQPDGTHQVLKFNSAGGLVGTFSPD